MKLLVLTQIMDRTDPTLGFFVPWVEELAKRIDSVHVICLQKGGFELPSNVTVSSLGKESGGSRFLYILRFFKQVFARGVGYDAVLVHMNHEYVILVGWWWRLTGKRVYLWRNHYEGSLLVDIASLFCTKVFCTSRYSYTASYKHTVFMPTGVNIESLMPEIAIERTPRSILALGRLSPSKRPEFLLSVYLILKNRGVPFTASFVGGAKESEYQTSLEELRDQLGLQDQVTFVGAVPNTETFRYYRAADVFVNASKSGMLDKSMFKAMAAGALVVSASQDLAKEVSEEFVFEEGNAENLADKLEYLLSLNAKERAQASSTFASVVESNSLPVLADKLVREMSVARNT